MKRSVNQWILVLLTAVFALLLTNCVIYEQPPRHTMPAGTTHYVIYSDIEWVVWEYYDWDYELVTHLHSLNYTPDEVCLILFLAYHGHSHPLTIVKWRQKHISWMDITMVHLKLKPSVFFVAIAPEVKLGPPYGKAYGYYRKSPNKIVLTKAQMVSLVHLKVASQALDISPIEVMKLKNRGYTFDQIVQAQVNAGKEIKTHKGRIIKKRHTATQNPATQTLKKPAQQTKPNKIDNPKNKPKKPQKDKEENTDRKEDKSDKPKQDKSTKDEGENKNKKKGKSSGKDK
ncbi:hypothetical protein ACFL5I_00850 [Planctomycetota bacterium]